MTSPESEPYVTVEKMNTMQHEHTFEDNDVERTVTHMHTVVETTTYSHRRGQRCSRCQGDSV